MYDHSKSKRFNGFDFSYEIIFESENHDLVLEKEKEFIKIYDTYYNGLNESLDGSGNHNAPNFTTLGFTFSDKSKKKMSDSHRKRFKNGATSPMLGKTHSDEVKKEWSRKRKGRVWSKKFDEETVKSLLIEYKQTPVEDTEISKNGRPLDHLRKFCNKNAKKYNMSSANIRKIILGQTIAWKHLYNEILGTKS